MKTKLNLRASITHHSSLVTLLLTFIILHSSFCLPASAQGTAFTYQGRLNSSGAATSGSYDFRFRLASDAFGNNYVGSALLLNAAPVSNGLFTATLDFGAGIFTGSNYWLEVAVKTNAAVSYTVLMPLQAVTPTPYAIMADSASNLLGNLPAAKLSGTIPSAQLAGTYSGAVTLNNAANSFTGNGTGVTNVNAASLNGLNSSHFWQLVGPNVFAGQFLGSTNNQPVELKVGGIRALRLELNTLTNGAPNVIGGSSANYVSAVAVGVTISGGGTTNYAGNARTNTVLADYGTVGGGLANRINSSSTAATIAGGENNNIANNSTDATIAGGYNNDIATNSSYATIAGGYINHISTNASFSAIGGGGGGTIAANSQYASIAGGYNNDIGTNSDFGKIGGGNNNNIADNSQYATIGGGGFNNIANYSSHATIGGGGENLITSNSTYATIPGGKLNIATNYAFAAGHRAKAIHTGAFVWADSQDADFPSTATNQFLIRASGGVGINTNSPQSALHVNGTITATNFAGSGASLTALNAGNLSSGIVADARLSNNIVRLDQNNTFTGTMIVTNNSQTPLQVLGNNSGGSWLNLGNSSGGGSTWNLISSGSGNGEGAGKLLVRDSTQAAVLMTFSTNGNVGIGTSSPTNKLHVIGGVSATVFVTTSDRNAKEKFAPVSAQDVLAKVAALPITRWSFKEMPGQTHLGPMAQDFRAAFELGQDDTGIATVDADGVALAAIQGLNEKVEVRSQKSEASIQELKAELQAKDAELEKLKASIEALRQLVLQQGRSH